VREPKFLVGQIVVIRGRGSRTDFGRRVTQRRLVGKTWRYRVLGAHCDGGGFPERELRQQTAREKGDLDRKGEA